MSSTLSKFLIFATGAAVGSVVSWRILKPYYEQIAQEEIESVKETFARRKAEFVSSEEDIQPTEEEVTEYNEMAIEYRTSDSRKEDHMSRPYVIPPEEFGDYPDYERVSLTYYADGVLTDENDDPIDDVEDVVGEDSLTTFGRFEDDSVFVRDDELKRDYEILADTRRYTDITKTVCPSDAEE